MADQERHYVAYHNTERMGRSFSGGRVVTNKSVERLHGRIVWLIVGEGRQPRRFSLGSVFRVTEEGNTTEEGFKHFAAGPAHRFDPPVLLNEFQWFDGFKKAMNQFQFGIQPIKNEQHIASLKEIVATAGASLP